MMTPLALPRAEAPVLPCLCNGGTPSSPTCDAALWPGAQAVVACRLPLPQAPGVMVQGLPRTRGVHARLVGGRGPQVLLAARLLLPTGAGLQERCACMQLRAHACAHVCVLKRGAYGCSVHQEVKLKCVSLHVDC